MLFELPSNHSLNPLTLCMVIGGQCALSERQGTPWSGCHTNVFTLTPLANLESQIYLHVFGLWKVTEVSGGHPCEHTGLKV